MRGGGARKPDNVGRSGTEGASEGKRKKNGVSQDVLKGSQGGIGRNETAVLEGKDRGGEKKQKNHVVYKKKK